MAAQSGVARFVGLQSGQTYNKQIYFDDTANNAVKFDAGAGAGATTGDSFWTPPELVQLVDFVLAAATGQTKTQLTRNGVPTGDILLNAIHLASITTRPGLSMTYGAGSKVGAIQLA